MASTKLLRKARVNVDRQRVRKQAIQLLNAKPVIKKVDVEALKEEFAKNKKPVPTAKGEKVEKAAPKAKKEAAPKKETAKAPKAEKEVEAKEEKTEAKAPKAEKKEAPKKDKEDKKEEEAK